MIALGRFLPGSVVYVFLSMNLQNDHLSDPATRTHWQSGKEMMMERERGMLKRLPVDDRDAATLFRTEVDTWIIR